MTLSSSAEKVNPAKYSSLFFICQISAFCAAEDSESFESESSKTQGNILNQTIKPQSVSVLHAYEDLFCHWLLVIRINDLNYLRHQLKTWKEMNQCLVGWSLLIDLCTQHPISEVALPSRPCSNPRLQETKRSSRSVLSQSTKRSRLPALNTRRRSWMRGSLNSVTE